MSSKPSELLNTPRRFSKEVFTAPRALSTLSVVTPALNSLSPPQSSFQTTSMPPSRAPSRVESPSYREKLKDNGISFISTREAPDQILQRARDILSRPRNSPGLSEEDAEHVVKYMYSLRDGGDESTVQTAYTETRILPGHVHLHKSLVTGGNQTFDTTGIPQRQNAPELSAPKPGRHFAYDPNLFSIPQKSVLNHPSIQRYTRPMTTGYLPFFTVEFKSTARLGSVWFAENQAATSGAFCVNSMEQLLAITNTHAEKIESISFSCVMNESSAIFWLHYCNRVTTQHFSVDVKRYWLDEPTNVIACRNSIKNILSWAYEERLPDLLHVLDKCEPQYLNEQRKVEHKRKCDV